MKKLFVPVLLFLAWNATAAEKSVKSSVKNVTVFTQGAQVLRSSNVTLSPGITDLVFSNISQFINPSSVQAGGKGDFTILEVRHQIKYPEPKKPTDGTLPPEVKRELSLLEDSMSSLTFRHLEILDKQSALMLEKNMIIRNKLSQGEGKSDSLPVLKQAMELFRIKLSDINAQLSKIRREEQKINKDSSALSARLNDLRTYKNSEDPNEKYQPIHQVIVTVSADAETQCSVDVSYMVSQAGWVPSYDLRSTTAAAPVQITYKANVFQNSGEEWNNVRLKLSTSNPNRGNTKPILPPWYINYYTYLNESKLPQGARETTAGNVAVTDEEFSDAKKQLDKMSPAQSSAHYSQLVETMSNVMFDISLPYSIPSDNANHIVSIKTGELPAMYYHYAVPKLESEAFLLAKVTGWEELNLLPGRANVFYEGTYVGETVLNPAVINDTLDLAFGRDNGVMITRTRKPVKEANALLGNDITKTVVYELKLKNNKSKALNLVVEDQIPLSQNKDIKVEMKDIGKADYNSQTGALKWIFSLNPKEYSTLSFSYAVTYNRGMPLSMF